MSQHLNRLNNEEALEFDEAFKEFCEVENQENKMNTRITLQMTAKDVLIAMSGGNPGALTVCMDIMKEGAQIDPQGLGGFGAILTMDTLGIHEHRIWMLYKDVCGENLEKMLGVLRANQLGFVSAEILNNAIDNRGVGIDVNNLFSKVKERLPEFAVDKSGEDESDETD